jgi:putative ABC transport system permease protein
MIGRGCGLALAIPGVALGTAGAFVLTRVMRTMLFGVGTAGTPTYAAVVLLVLATAVLASYLPARRASRLDPIQTLR